MHQKHQYTGIWHHIRQPLIRRIRTIMSCGLAPQPLAMTLCLGCAFGVMPLLWGVSLFLIALAHTFRLNHLVLQSLSYLLWPLQLLLLVPFATLGNRLLPWGEPLPVHLTTALFHEPGRGSLATLGWLTGKALAAWLVTMTPLTLCGYVILRATVLKDAAPAAAVTPAPAPSRS